MKFIRKSRNASNQFSFERHKIVRYCVTVLFAFVILLKVQYLDGCRSSISRLGFDLPKFELKQNKDFGRVFTTKGRKDHIISMLWITKI